MKAKASQEARDAAAEAYDATRPVGGKFFVELDLHEQDRLEVIAKYLLASEREACAKVADQRYKAGAPSQFDWDGRQIANAIRSRAD